jgi:hypothetical protein
MIMDDLLGLAASSMVITKLGHYGNATACISGLRKTTNFVAVQAIGIGTKSIGQIEAAAISGRPVDPLRKEDFSSKTQRLQVSRDLDLFLRVSEPWR